MSFERMPGPIGTEPALPAGVGGSSDVTRDALRLQVLATEHWGLLATRSMAWNELFARAGMFLTTLSGAIVALALVAQATEFGVGFAVFALAILPVVLFIGIASVIRMGRSAYYDGFCIVGMNRIRHAYLQLTPEVEPYLVMGTHDDLDGISLTAGDPPGASGVTGVIASITFVITIVNAVVGAAIAAIVGQLLEFTIAWTVGAGLIGFLIVFGVQGFAAYREISTGVANYEPKFPAPGANRGSSGAVDPPGA